MQIRNIFVEQNKNDDKSIGESEVVDNENIKEDLRQEELTNEEESILEPETEPEGDETIEDGKNEENGEYIEDVGNENVQNVT